MKPYVRSWRWYGKCGTSAYDLPHSRDVHYRLERRHRRWQRRKGRMRA